MAKRKSEKNQLASPKREGAKAGTDTNLEPRVVALAAQLGTFLGRLQKKADGLIGNAEMRRQVSQIRDGAEDLLKQVNKAGAAMRKSVETAATAKKAKPKSARTTKGRSGGAVDAPGKRHRKPPPQELFDPRLGEPMGKQMGQKNLNRRRGRA